MSAAQDEADDGPDASSDEGVQEDRSLQYHQSEVSQEDGLPMPKLANPNGLREDDSLAVGDDRSRGSGRGEQNVASEDLGSLRVSRLGPERPSSADGSLSIPDDTPSVQVSWSLAGAIALSNSFRLL